MTRGKTLRRQAMKVGYRVSGELASRARAPGITFNRVMDVLFDRISTRLCEQLFYVIDQP